MENATYPLLVIYKSLKVDILSSGARGVEGIYALPVVVALETLLPHHLKKGAGGGDASVPSHQELHHFARRKQLLQRFHQCRVCAGIERKYVQ